MGRERKKEKVGRPKVHLIGIGGIGVSALARWFASYGWFVSGSDVERGAITQSLVEKDGVRVSIGRHAKKNVPRGADLIIYSPAVAESNPELKAARAANVPALSYPAAVGALTRNHATIAVAGAHGKSTTTALIGLMLIKGELDPTIIVGTNLRELGGKNFRHGGGPHLVLEADEYGRAFHHHSPSITVVTNIDREHLDTYGTIAGVKRAFKKFIRRTVRGGTLVLNRDNPPLRGMGGDIRKIARARGLRVFWYYTKNRMAHEAKKHIRIAGAHNVSNAVAALTVAVKVLKIKKARALEALGKYRGAWRRMEYRGELKVPSETYSMPPIKTLVFDDYAHHPTEIRATLSAFREKFPHARIICVFQPHQAKRLGFLFGKFIDAFRGADALILLPVYQVAGRDKVDPRFTSKTLAAAIQKKYARRQVLYLANPKNLKTTLVKLTRGKTTSKSKTEAVIVMMGAGDIIKHTSALI